jgi:hypothetical protein
MVVFYFGWLPNEEHTARTLVNKKRMKNGNKEAY